MVEFVRYSPGIERNDPNFEHALETVLEQMKQHMSASAKAEGAGRVVRDAHAKGFGLAQGEVEILRVLPTEYAQGVYAKPGRHEAIVRFSNGTAHISADRFLPSGSGIGLKMFGIDGPTLLEDEPDGGTFDYAMINYPIFFVNTIEHYIFIQRLFTNNAGTIPDPNELPEERKARLRRFLHDWVTGDGTLPPEQWAWEELAAFVQLAQIPFVNLLLSTYWTMGAVRHGDYVAKVRVAPVKEFADRVQLRELDRTAEEIFRPPLVAELRERPFEFDIQVQLCTSLDLMPVEDVTVRWPENLSPFVTVAKLRLPKQDIGGNDNLEIMDRTSMSPWRVTEEHRPLGNIMRSRKEVYRQSSILRHQANHQPRKEPKNLAEVFAKEPELVG